MDKKDYADIEMLFNEDTELPHGISKENMLIKLKGCAHKAYPKKKNNKVFVKITAAAASVAIVAASIFAAKFMPVNVKIDPATTFETNVSLASPTEYDKDKNDATTAFDVHYEKIDVGIEPKTLSRFSSEADMKNYFLNLAKKESLYNLPESFNFGSITADGTANGFFEDKAAAPLMDSNSITMAASSSDGTLDKTLVTGDLNESGSFSETNTQVKGVDEADVIKNDGRYLYIVSNSHTTYSYTIFTIIDTKTMQAVFSDKLQPQDSKKILNIREIYLNGNRLVVVGNEYDKGNDEITVFKSYEVCDCIAPYTGGKAVCAVYDVSDKSAPKQLRYITQDGSIISTRMIGTVLYTVTSYYVGYDSNSLKERYAPEINGEKIDYSDVYIIDKDAESTSYNIVTAVDTAKNDSAISKASVIGDGFEVYCSTANLYIMNSRWTNDVDQTNDRVTDIFAFSLDADKVSFKGTGVVPGYIDDNYSIDEYNGFLRIATTDYNYNTDKDISSLYILDSKLNVIGKAFDIAEDEQVKAVRYMGDYAYVVTFRNTDPLFVINLSDPSKPTVEGEVKLPGFSEYLHPVGNGMLVGVGYCGNEDNANYDSVKISLFDVSDPKKPKELDSHEIKNASTDVNYQPKAFMYYEEENMIGLPISYEEYDARGNYRGASYQYKLISIENGKFSEKQNFVHTLDSNDYTSIFRGAYIGKTLYTITDTKICEFDMDSAELLRSLRFAKSDDTLKEDMTSPVAGTYNDSNGAVKSTEAPDTVIAWTNGAIK